MDRLAVTCGPAGRVSARLGEWAGLRVPDPAHGAERDLLAGGVREARTLSAEYENLLSHYGSPEYAHRVAGAEAALKTLRDQDFHQRLNLEFDDAADRVIKAVGNGTLLKLVALLLPGTRQENVHALRRVHATILAGLAERLPQLVQPAGPLYLEQVDFALLLRAVEKEMAAR